MVERRMKLIVDALQSLEFSRIFGKDSVAQCWLVLGKDLPRDCSMVRCLVLLDGEPLRCLTAESAERMAKC